jgi:hypothetical protein
MAAAVPTSRRVSLVLVDAAIAMHLAIQSITIIAENVATMCRMTCRPVTVSAAKAP